MYIFTYTTNNKSHNIDYSFFQKIMLGMKGYATFLFISCTYTKINNITTTL